MATGVVGASWKSLLGRKLRLVMSTFAIVLGVGFVVGSLVFTDMLDSGFTKIFSSATGDVVVRHRAGVNGMGGPTDRTVPASLVGELADLEEVARADGNVGSEGVFVIGKDRKLVGGMGAPGLGLNWTDAPAQGGGTAFSLVGGRAPDGPDEVVLDTWTAEQAGYVIGERVLVTTLGSRDILRPTMVGLSEFGEGGTLAGASLTAFDTETAQELFLDGRREYNDIWLAAAEGYTQQEVAAAAREVLPQGVIARTGEAVADESAEGLSEALGFLRTFLLVFAGISLFVGAFLIVNTFAMLVAQRSRELALLRALGASTRQVFASVILEAAVVGVVGSTIGIGFGLVLARGLAWLFAQFGLDLSGQQVVLTPLTVLAAYLIGVLVTVLAAAIPAWRTRRLAPVQALTDQVAMPEGSMVWRFLGGMLLAALGVGAMALGLLTDVPRGGWVTAAGAVAVLLGVSVASPVLGRPVLGLAGRLFGGLFGTVGKLAGENTNRNPRRTTVTASALMIGLALACTVAILGASGKATTADVIERTLAGDYVVGNPVGQPFSPDVARRMAEVDGVEQVVRQRGTLSEYDGDDRWLGAIDPSGLGPVVKVEVAEGDLADFTDGTLVVDTEWADEEGVGVGDRVTWTMPEGDRALEVVAVVEPQQLVFIPATTPRTMARGGYKAVDSMLFVDTGGQDRLAELKEVVADNPLVNVNDQAGLIEQQSEQADQGLLMIYGLLALALVIAVLGIVNTLALSVIERTREIGLLRAVGMTRGQMRRMISLESVAIAVLGSLLGLLLGLFFGVAVYQAFRDEGLEVLDIPVGQLSVFLAAAVVVGVLAAIFPARRAARLDVLRAIATE